MRINLTIPDDLLAAIDEQAKRDGTQSRSEWLAECALANLARDIAAKVGPRRPRGRPPKPSK